MIKTLSNYKIIVGVVIVAYIIAIVLLCLLGYKLFQQVLLDTLYPASERDSGNVHLISYLEMQDLLSTPIVESMGFCSWFSHKSVCAYETEDRYYFYLSGITFGDGYFPKPGVTFSEGNLKLTLVNTLIIRDIGKEDYYRFYINKSDFPDVTGVMLNYYLYDEDWNILEHKEEPLVFPNFDANLKYRNKVK